MMLWKLACAVLAVGVALATLPGEVSAQQAGARPQLAGASARPAPVRARDLMTPQERQAYTQGPGNVRLQIRSADDGSGIKKVRQNPVH